jgi:hypothetical protein
MLYLVSYDLLNKATFGDYENLIDALKRLNAQRVLLSEWVLKNSDTSANIRDYLMPHIHQADRLLVTELDPVNWASWNALVDINKL